MITKSWATIVAAPESGIKHPIAIPNEEPTKACRVRMPHHSQKLWTVRT